MTEAAIIQALTSPSAYPHPVERVEFVSTHLSLVFLAGPLAYKVKRTVDLGFVDFTSLESRHRACVEEVRLNRRLAPEVYRGLRAIAAGADGALTLLELDAAPEASPPVQSGIVDFAVEMARLPAEGMLDRLLAEGAVAEADVDELASLLADFRRRCETDAQVAALGAPQVVRSKILANLAEMRRDRWPDGLPVHAPLLLDHLERWSEQELARQAPLLRRRAEAGLVRDGHGDLHCGNICRRRLASGADEWIVFDCIEFRKDFRCLDAAAEISCLAMDMAHRGDPRLARRLLERFMAETRDETLAELFPLFASHYASVRAKVIGLRAAESANGQRSQDAVEAMSFLSHAVAATMPRPLILLCGLPASGKSRAAAALARAFETTPISSDRVRKELAGLAPSDRRGRDPSFGLYSPEMSERTLAEIARRAEDELRAGRAAVVDATSSTRRWRDALAEAALRAGAPGGAWLVWLDPSDQEIRRRLAERARRPDEPSDADAAVYEQLRQRFERPDEWPFDRLLVVADARTPEAVAEALVAGMVRERGRTS